MGLSREASEDYQVALVLSPNNQDVLKALDMLQSSKDKESNPSEIIHVDVKDSIQNRM